MAAVINTNIPSLNAQRNLSTSQSQLATSLQRLSSGLRINSAKDDAAGLAISERFSTQIRGMNVAVRNANDGISLAQSAEGAMTEIGNNLQRIRELAVQSRNATNSDSDRTALNAEAQQLKAEVDRVASTTAFNGTKLLDGSFTAKAFQVGANQGETIDIAKITNASSAELGAWKSVDVAAVAGSYTKNSVSSFDFASSATIPASAATYTSGAIATGNYSSTAGTESVYTSAAVTPKDYSGAGSATFNITGAGGTGSITLDTDITSAADMLTALTTGANATALASAGVAATAGTGADLNKIVFTSTTQSATNVSLDATGTTELGGAQTTAGAAPDNSANKTFTITGTGGTGTVTLNTNITSAADMFTALTTGANAAALASAGVTAAAGTGLDAGKILFTSTTPGVGNITIGGTDAALISTGSTAVAGSASSTTNNNAGFTVDSTTVSLTTNVTNQAGLISAIQTQLGAGYVVAASGTSGFSITSATAGAATPAAISAYTGTGSANFGGGTVVAGADAIAGTAQTGFAGLDISTTDGADAAILAMDGALTALNSARADMGAVQNRFTSVVASLQTTAENMTASRSRILDADFAAETANLTRGQILQQAGTAMLAQANSLPNGVLALLRG